MVDTIRIITQIYEELNEEKWDITINEETGEFYYESFIHKVIRIAFYPYTDSLIITGNFLKLQCKTKVKNMDDVFTSKQELINLLLQLEKEISAYFKNPIINIFREKITRIDYCFNIETLYVCEYVKFFNLYYKKNKDKFFKKYINHTVEHNLDEDSSFYLKTEGQYIKNLNQNFTINFYNKTDQLCNKFSEDIMENFRSNITEKDMMESRNILRLEVQVHYAKLKSICKKNNIPWDKRCLSYLLDIDIARNVICSEIKRFFTECDFCSFDYTKKRVIEEHKGDKKLLEYIIAIARNNTTSTYQRYSNTLKDMGICPYMFIPRDWNIEKLENPIKLIDRKIKENNLQNLTLRKDVKKAC